MQGLEKQTYSAFDASTRDQTHALASQPFAVKVMQLTALNAMVPEQIDRAKISIANSI